jgi:putative endopeptidase
MQYKKLGILVTICLALALVAAARQTGGGRGFDTKSLDASVQACQDFNQFANGGWVKSNPIPAAYPSWGRFNELAERNRDTLHQILEDAAKNTRAAKGSNEQKIGDYYASCMDEAKVEAEGLKPLLPELERIGRIKDRRGLQAEVARLHDSGVGVMFGFGSTQDAKQSTQVIGEADQGGLGLPDRDYYLKADDRSKAIREAYVKYVAKMFELMGDAPAKAEAEAGAVMALETKLAQASKTRVERRDPEANYHKTTLAELKQLTPAFSWADYFRDIGAPPVEAINVGQPDFFKELDKQLTAAPLADWQSYMRFHLVTSAAPALSSKFVQASFDFYSTTLTGTKEILPRWKRCVSATNGALGEAVGQVYVEKTFTPEAKSRAVRMVQNLIAALHDDLQTLDWMSGATRAQATAKLDAFVRKIGYPDRWRDYSALQVDRGSYIENRFRAVRFESARDTRKIGKPVDRTEWGMTPPTVNAYYNPSMNEIVFPAGILQPPFFDPAADDAINYGGIGAVIGHEMTHGFDDQGAQFDAAGNLKNWWTPEDKEKFGARAGCVVKQFDAYEVEAGLHEQGKLVVGESIADLGGLKLAYLAFQKSLQGKPRPADVDGFTPEQRFFLGWAQVWADNVRPEFARLLAQTDPHPLARFRVNGPLSNMPEFAAAYQCKAGDPMVRQDRCQIW